MRSNTFHPFAYTKHQYKPKISWLDDQEVMQYTYYENLK